MKIKEEKTFVTPKDMDDLINRLNSFSGQEKAIAWLAAMMAWNLACKLTNEELEESNAIN
tara:strand:+ start:160 stop:339 length:180 start_codon:yes stop_codon:yes gene_type:complete